MYQSTSQKSDCTEKGSLAGLLLAYFVPIYYKDGCFALNTVMVSTYAGIYIKRNRIAALVTFICGELFVGAGHTLSGTLITGLFVLFASLCVVYLAAITGNNRNHP